MNVALVTGAGSGIGRAIAVALAADGWQVALLGRTRASLSATAAALGEAGANAHLVEVDVRDVAAVREAVALVEEQSGPIDALVNNAGVQRLAPATDVEEQDWDLVLGTNLKGAFFCAQAVGRRMLERGTGCVVNIASAAAVVAVADRVAYASSKAGMVMMTKVMALEWAATGVRVNAVAPTFVETDLGRQTLDQPGRRDEITASIPMRRLAGTGDVVGAVRFLLDDAASGFITGQVLSVDGGLSL